MSLTSWGPAMIQCFVPLSVRARFIVQKVTINSREWWVVNRIRSNRLNKEQCTIKKEKTKKKKTKRYNNNLKQYVKSIYSTGNASQPYSSINSCSSRTSHFPIGLQWNADYEILTRITLHASMTYGRDWSRKLITQLLYPSPADYAYARHHHLGVTDTCCDISVGYSSVAATTWPDHTIETVIYLRS